MKIEYIDKKKDNYIRIKNDENDYEILSKDVTFYFKTKKNKRVCLKIDNLIKNKMDIKNTSIFIYDKETEKTVKTTLEKLLDRFEKSIVYPYRTGKKFFFSDKKCQSYKKKYEKWLDNL